MKSILFQSLFFLLALTLSCAPKQSDTSESEQAPEEQPAAETAESQSYVVTVLNPDIPSPRKEMKGKIGEVEIVVNFGSPSVKGREIWGALVPYGKRWRTGANEATSFEVSADVNVEGAQLAAGKYALFTIPDKDSWTIIFNTQHDQWGDNSYDEAKDALRVTTKPQKAAQPSETMEFAIEDDAVVLKWADVAVPFKVAIQ